MTNQELEDCRLFFLDDPKQGGVNCKNHPNVAKKKGLALIAEVDRLRAALASIHVCSFEAEETSATWRDISGRQTRIAAKALGLTDDNPQELQAALPKGFADNDHDGMG